MTDMNERSKMEPMGSEESKVFQHAYEHCIDDERKSEAFSKVDKLTEHGILKTCDKTLREK